MSTISLFGRNWTISYISLPGFSLPTVEELIPVAVLTGGTIFSFLVFIVLNTLSTSQRRAILKAIEMTKELAESEQKYKNIFNNLPDIYYLTNLNGTILSVSPSFTHYTGVKSQDAVGKNISQFYMDPNDRAKLVFDELKKDQVIDYPLTLRGQGGQYLFMSLSARVIRDLAGNPKHLEGFLRDITERKKAEDTLRARTAEIEKLNNSLIGRELKMIELKEEIENLKKNEK